MQQRESSADDTISVFARSADQIVVLENERWLPFGRFSGSNLLLTDPDRWSNGSSRTDSASNIFQLTGIPITNWKILVDSGTEEDGWKYAFDFSKSTLQISYTYGKKKAGQFVRRREWVLKEEHVNIVRFQDRFESALAAPELDDEDEDPVASSKSNLFVSALSKSNLFVSALTAAEQDDANIFLGDSTLPKDPDPCIEGRPLNKEELAVLSKVQDIFPDCMDRLGNELVTRTIRGYQDYDNRIKDTADALQKIAVWRSKERLDCITSRKLPQHDLYHKLWPGYVAGEDAEGHVIHYECITDVDVKGLVEMKKTGCTQDDLNIYRAQFLEAVEEYKRRRSFKNGRRRYKEVTILNLEGFSLSLFSASFKEIVLGSVAIGGAYYPDALHKMLIVNAPFLFRTVWAAISPFIHPNTRAKIKIIGGKKAYLAEFEKAGILLSQVPLDIGGSFELLAIKDILADAFLLNEQPA